MDNDWMSSSSTVQAVYSLSEAFDDRLTSNPAADALQAAEM